MRMDLNTKDIGKKIKKSEILFLQMKKARFNNVYFKMIKFKEAL